MDEQLAGIVDVLPGIGALLVVLTPVAFFVSSAITFAH